MIRLTANVRLGMLPKIVREDKTRDGLDSMQALPFRFLFRSKASQRNMNDLSLDSLAPALAASWQPAERAFMLKP